MSFNDKKKGDPEEPLPWQGSRIFGIHGSKTVVIITDYTKEYNEAKDIFNKEQ